MKKHSELHRLVNDAFNRLPLVPPMANDVTDEVEELLRRRFPDAEEHQRWGFFAVACLLLKRTLDRIEGD